MFDVSLISYYLNLAGVGNFEVRLSTDSLSIGSDSKGPLEQRLNQEIDVQRLFLLQPASVAMEGSKREDYPNRHSSLRRLQLSNTIGV